MIALGVFLAALALDYAAARYQRAVSARQPGAAACFSVAMCLLSSVALLALVEVSRWMLVPECLGLWAGTYLGVLRSGEP